MDCSMPSLPVHRQLPEFTQTHVHWVGDAIQLSHPLSSPSPPAFNLCQHQVFSNDSALHIRWPKYWSFSFSISPSNEHPGLICRMDWLDLLAVQGILKSLLQHYSSKASILWHSTFFIVQLSHPYTTTGKAMALTRQTFVDKVTSLLFNMLSRFVITFLPSRIIFNRKFTLGLPWWFQLHVSTAADSGLIPVLGTKILHAHLAKNNNNYIKKLGWFFFYQGKGRNSLASQWLGHCAFTKVAGDLVGELRSCSIAKKQKRVG